jgi:hypothetical protein
LSDSHRAVRKVFFDFATLPERARRAAGNDSNGYAARFNGYAEFAAPAAPTPGANDVVTGNRTLA